MMKATFILHWKMSLCSCHGSDVFKGLRSVTVYSLPWGLPLDYALQGNPHQLHHIHLSEYPLGSDFVLGFLFITALENVNTKQSQCCFTWNSQWTTLLLRLHLTIWLSAQDHNQHSTMDDGRAQEVPPLQREHEHERGL